MNLDPSLGEKKEKREENEVNPLGPWRARKGHLGKREKGKEGEPGQIKGTVASGETLGDVYGNTEFGIYGTFYDEADLEKAVYVASRNEIVCGKATMLCCTVGNTVEEYEIMIEKINPGSYDNKSMIISVTDQNLISKTGGIVQGMSGSPILQNGKLVGAVTHVFVNDPTRGYGIFIENMLVNTD